MSRPKKPHVPNFGRIVRIFSKVAASVAERNIADFAEQERDVFVRSVKAQIFPDFDLSPLTPKYLARKIRLGLDPRVMISTGHYLKAIQVFKRVNRDNSITFHVGFHARERARDTEGKRIPFLMRHLAEVHEHGSVKQHIPRRRHWGPYYKAMHSRAPFVRALIHKEIQVEAKPALKGLV
jgi:hypothetical protein